MIKLINVSKKFKNFILFENVNIDINTPGIYSFIGNNGCGKTTLLNVVSGFISPSEGKVINDFKNISFVSQKINLIENLTIKEHFDMMSLNYNLLKKVHLSSKLYNYPRELSFGMRQRVAVLLSLYSSATLIICDEPTSHLDNYNANLIMKEIKKISKDKIVLLVSHDKNFIDKYSNEIYIFENKTIKLLKTDSTSKGTILNSKNKMKFNTYLWKSVGRNKKDNILFFFIFFFLFFMLSLGFNLRFQLKEYISFSGQRVIDYNKFYLKECQKETQENTIIRKCFNLSEEKVNLLKNREYQLVLNYDVFLNDLYEVENLNIVNKKNYILKEGRIPTVFNEVVASGNYFIGQEIELSTNKIINFDKVDIYKNSMILKVVGIIENKPFIKENKIFVDYDLINNYLEKEMLINNNISLLDYFQKLEVNNYKYVLYFDDIDLDVLESNDIGYLSASYEFYQSLQEAFSQIIRCLDCLSFFMLITAIIYDFKLTRKKVKIKEGDISFFKANGIRRRKIMMLINKENIFIIFFAAFLSFAINVSIAYLFFGNVTLNCLGTVLSFIMVSYLNNRIVKNEVWRNYVI